MRLILPVIALLIIPTSLYAATTPYTVTRVSSYEDSNVKANLTKVYWEYLDGKKIIVFEVEFEVITKTKVIKKLFDAQVDIFSCTLSDNFEFLYPCRASTMVNTKTLASRYPSLNPANPLPAEARFGDKGTIVYVCDEVLRGGSSLLLLKIEKEFFGNVNEIEFRIPISFIGKKSVVQKIAMH